VLTIKYGLIVLALIAAGCSIGEWIGRDVPPASLRSYPPHYDAGVRMIGRTVDDTVEQIGRPDFILDGRPRYGEYKDGIPVLSYVYMSETYFGTNCIDVLVVTQQSGKVARYHCR
jgi:hypothetical protein